VSVIEYDDTLRFRHGWNPISTAPLDGTAVRLFVDDHQGVGSFAVHMDGGSPEWRMHSKDIGWCRENPPTHWMRL
jgi:hypothetical protein